MTNINYNSDFDFILQLYDCKGNELPFPNYDFTATFYTSSKFNTFVAKRKHGKLTNCFDDNGRLHIVCNNHGLKTGKLKVDFVADLPDSIYPDGHRVVFTPRDIDITLVSGAGDCSMETDTELVIPYIYSTAYELAKSAGYTGTLEEYTQAVNELPQLTQEAKNINAILSDVAEGKREIAEAVAKWVPDVTEQTSYKEMADKILDLPVKPKDFVAEYPDTLLGFLRANERKDYPYMWGVEFIPTEEEENALQLTGADAYLLDDGTFYEGDATHKFEDNWQHQTRKVIFYHREKDYTVFAPFLYNTKIMPYSGEPDYNITDNNKVVVVIESVIDTPYRLAEGRIVNITISHQMNVDLKGWKGNVSLSILSLGNARLVSLEDLEEINVRIDASNATWTYYTKFPSLKKIVNGVLYAQFFKGTEISLPLLESISGGTIASGCPLVTQISLPLLESISGGGQMIVSLHNLIEIELPSLRSISTSNVLINNCQGLKKFYAPQLMEVTMSSHNMFGGCYVIDDITFGEGCVYNQGSPILSSSCSVKKASIKGLAEIKNGGVLNNNITLKEIELPNLKIVSNGNVFNNCSALTDVGLPNLESITAGTIFSACNALTEVELPNLKSITGGIVFNNCTGLISGKFPNLETFTNIHNNYAIFLNCNEIEEINFPKLEVAASSTNTMCLVGFNSSSNRKNDIVINLPALRDTRAILQNGTSSSVLYPISGMGGALTGHTFTINLGAPQDGYIYMAEGWSQFVVTSITVQPGFRSYLRIDTFGYLPKEVLEDIITNLGDNSDYETIQIVFGATNLAKISDEKKLEATNKNYTLS